MKDRSATDRRVLRSKLRMRAALVELLRCRSFEEISVVEIVREAAINRGTFYKHYRIKEDLLHEWTDEMMEELREAYRAPFADSSSFTIEELSPSAVKIFDHIQSRRQFYETAFFHFPGFEETFTSVFAGLMQHELKTDPPAEYERTDLFAVYQSYAFYGLIKHWVKEGFAASPGWMASELYRFITADFRQKKYIPLRKDRSMYG